LPVAADQPNPPILTAEDVPCNRHHYKEIASDRICSSQFKKATASVNGSIQFSLLGGAETKRGGCGAAQDKDATMFTNRQQPWFERAKELVDLHREAARNAPAESNPWWRS